MGMATHEVDLKKNADGTITAIYYAGKRRRHYSFKDEPWYSDADRYDQALWGFIGLGVRVDPEVFNMKRRRKRS